MNQNITPLPWTASNHSVYYCVDIHGGVHEPVIADTGYSEFIDDKTKKANAAYIVKACNAYPQLVEALKELVQAVNPRDGQACAVWQDEPVMVKARALLATLEES